MGEMYCGKLSRIVVTLCTNCFEIWVIYMLCIYQLSIFFMILYFFIEFFLMQVY